MTVYELIKELTSYPADTEIYAEVGNSGLKLDIGSVDSEFHGYPLPRNNRAVIVLDP